MSGKGDRDRTDNHDQYRENLKKWQAAVKAKKEKEKK